MSSDSSSVKAVEEAAHEDDEMDFDSQASGRDSYVDSLMFESNGFDKDALDHAIEERK